jgi:hypothetical protein
MISQIHRIPKWLLQERFEIRIYPTIISVKLFVMQRGAVQTYEGHGNSIAEAAKKARPEEPYKRPDWTLVPN